MMGPDVGASGLGIVVTLRAPGSLPPRPSPARSGEGVLPPAEALLLK